MKPETSFPSFKNFKCLLFASLSEQGFSSAGDIAVKDVSEELRAQVVVAGNNYYLSISLQIAMPCAAKSLTRVMARHGLRKRFSSGKVYNPVLSADILAVINADEGLRPAVEQADWPALCADVESLSQLIASVYEDATKGPLLAQAFWWPERLTEEQAAMLMITVKRIGQSGLSNFVEQRYLSRAGGASPFGQYEQFLGEASEQGLTAR